MSSLLVGLQALIQMLSQRLWVVAALFGIFVLAMVRRRQLAQKLAEEELLLRRSEEESVLARRTLDFAHAAVPRTTENESTHKLPSREELQASVGIEDPSEEAPDEGLALSSGAGTLPPKAPEPDPEPPSVEASLPPSEPPPPEPAPETPAPAPRPLHEIQRRQEEVRQELLEGNRAVLEDLSHLVDAKAIEETENSLAEEPENLRLLDWLAMLYYAHDQVDLSAETYKVLIEREPQTPDFHCFLGNCYYKMNLLPEAVFSWQQALELPIPVLVQDEVLARIEACRELILRWEACGIFQPVTDDFIATALEAKGLDPEEWHPFPEEPAGEIHPPELLQEGSSTREKALSMVMDSPPEISDELRSLAEGMLEEESSSGAPEPPVEEEAPEEDVLRSVEPPEAHTPRTLDEALSQISSQEAGADQRIEDALSGLDSQVHPEDGLSKILERSGDSRADAEVQEALEALRDPQEAASEAPLASSVSTSGEEESEISEALAPRRSPLSFAVAPPPSPPSEESATQSEVPSATELDAGTSLSDPEPKGQAEPVPDAQPGSEAEGESPPEEAGASELRADSEAPSEEAAEPGDKGDFGGDEVAVPSRDPDPDPSSVPLVAPGPEPEPESKPSSPPAPPLPQSEPPPEPSPEASTSWGAPPALPLAALAEKAPRDPPSEPEPCPPASREAPEEIGALQDAFTELFDPSQPKIPPPAPPTSRGRSQAEAPAEETLLRSVQQLEAAREGLGSMDALELLESPLARVRVQTAHALTYTQRDLVSTLLSSPDPDLRFAGILGHLQRPEALHPLEIFDSAQVDPERSWAYWAGFYLGEGREARWENFPPLNTLPRGAWLRALLFHLPWSQVEPQLESWLAGPLSGSAWERLQEALGLSWLGLFLLERDSEPGEALKAVREFFPDQDRIPRALARSLLRSESVGELAEILLLEWEDRENDRPGAGPSLRLHDLCRSMLRILSDSSQSLDPSSRSTLGSFFLVLWNAGFYQAILTSLEAGEASALDLAALGREDLLVVLASEWMPRAESDQEIPATVFAALPQENLAQTRLEDPSWLEVLSQHPAGFGLALAEALADGLGLPSPESVPLPGYLSFWLRSGRELTPEALSELLASNRPRTLGELEDLAWIEAGSYLEEEDQDLAPGLWALKVRERRLRDRTDCLDEVPGSESLDAEEAPVGASLEEVPFRPVSDPRDLPEAASEGTPPSPRSQEAPAKRRPRSRRRSGYRWGGRKS